MRKGLLILGGCLAGLALVGGIVAWWVSLSRTAITRANYLQIQVGMTHQQVEEVLGGPSRDEMGGAELTTVQLIQEDGSRGEEMPGEPLRRWSRFRSEGFDRPPQIWISNQALVRLEFDRANRVANKTGMDLEYAPLPLFTRLRRWFGL